MIPRRRARGMNDVRILVVSCVGIYGLLAIFMGVIPGVTMSATRPGPGVVPLGAAAQRGRDVYVAEGCSYCHTQQVRPLAQDRVFGRPSTGGDYAYATPELLGSERNGPDLSNIGARQPSDVWQEIHLYQPRALVAGSIMPAYKWLFTLKDRADPADVVVSVPPAYAPAGKVVVATQGALDLVAYLKSLKQAALPTPAP
ncbi:MAG TPA: cbb3-type cytochrome c oxidase subunit II [Candidatus Acidoferrales bacterium]|nr:cbb3-type cytochrome c oxidase subunit II [Candidatus Acidoferrales bacterium]